MKTTKRITNEELEAAFDEGEDIGGWIDPSKVRRYSEGEERRDLTSPKVKLKCG